jgi:MmyB-like transcription regulator ligand binding domain
MRIARPPCGAKKFGVPLHPEFRGEYLQNAGPVMDRHASLFWRAYHLRPDEKEMNDVLASLKTNGEFLQRWRNLEEGENKIVLLEHDWLPLKHPRFGKLLFNIWRTAVAADERFMLAHFPPANDATQRALRRILRR